MPHTSLQPVLRRGVTLDGCARQQEYGTMLSVGLMAYALQIVRLLLTTLALNAAVCEARRRKSQTS